MDRQEAMSYLVLDQSCELKSAKAAHTAAIKGTSPQRRKDAK